MSPTAACAIASPLPAAGFPCSRPLRATQIRLHKSNQIAQLRSNTQFISNRAHTHLNSNPRCLLLKGTPSVHSLEKQGPRNRKVPGFRCARPWRANTTETESQFPFPGSLVALCYVRVDAHTTQIQSKLHHLIGTHYPSPTTVCDWSPLSLARSRSLSPCLPPFTHKTTYTCLFVLTGRACVCKTGCSVQGLN